MRLKNSVLTAALLAVFSCPVYAAKKTTEIDSDEVVEIIRVERQGSARNPFYMATIDMYGDFGSGTLHLLKSTDGGTTKNAVKYYSGGSLTSYTITDDSNIEVKNGWGSAGDGTIYYASTTGTTSPDITIDVMDNQ